MAAGKIRTRGAATVAALFLVAAGVAAASEPVAFAQRVRGGAMAMAGDPRSSSEARALLQRMLRADVSLPVAGREVTFSTQGGGGRQSEQSVKRDPKRGLRVEFSRYGDGGGAARDVLVDNFRRSWFLSQRRRRLYEGESHLVDRRRGMYDVLRQLKQGAISARVVGEDVVAGRPATIVFVSPPTDGTPAPARRFWIDRETGLRLKTEEVGPMGRVLSSTYFIQVDLRPRFTDDDFAAPIPPPDFERVRDERQTLPSIEAAQKMVRFALRRPTYLPPGFALRNVVVARRRGGSPAAVVFQRYANGMNSITLFQTDDPDAPAPGFHRDRSDRGRDGHRPDRGGGGGAPFGPGSGGPPSRGTRIQAWRAGNISFVLIADLPDDQMKRIADSVR